MAALQAWHEWLPVRPPVSMNDIIYRRFQYGDLLDLLMLDTRIIGRDEQFTYSDFATDGIIDVEQARAGFGDANRTLLGSEQLDWLREQLNQSSAQWQVLGQQVLMSRYLLPSPIMESLDPRYLPRLTRNWARALPQWWQRSPPKTRAPEDRTPEQIALLASAIPYNLDAWDGYAFERDEIAVLRAAAGLRNSWCWPETHTTPGRRS